jgi:hypothetical protein
VMVFADADIVISPIDNPFFTLKFLVVMVPFLPHDCC